MTNDKARSLPVAVSLLSLIVAALSLVVSAFNYSNARATREDTQRIARERQKLHLTGTPKDNRLELNPIDSSFSLGAITITFAADLKIPRQHQLPGNHAIVLNEDEPVLWNRSTANSSFGFKSAEKILEYIPIVVSAEYFFEGKHLISHALYQVFYVTSRKSANATIEPVSLKYCGELVADQVPIDFLIDSRFVTEFGYSDKPSVNVMFDCNAEHLVYMSIKKGQVVVRSDLTETESQESTSQLQTSPASSPDSRDHP